MKPDIRIMQPAASMPYGGFMARYAVPEIYDAIRKGGTSIVFVNTRAQAELMLQMLWDANEENLPIAVYHGSLSREQRRRTEAMMAAGKIRSVVATAALELGIDWGDVDLVIQVAAPKGVSRLLQRVGRSNHRLDVPSRAFLVPANRCGGAGMPRRADRHRAGPIGWRGVRPRLPRRCCATYLKLRLQRARPSRRVIRGDQNRPALRTTGPRRIRPLFQFAIDGGYVCAPMTATSG